MRSALKATRFTLRQLSYFVAAAETGSVTLAAQHVNVSQPSVSAAIAKLEGEFGLQFFVRHHAQGLSLTTSGRRFLEAARSVLDEAGGLYAVADEIGTQVGGPLEIGSFRTFTPIFVTDICKRFAEAYPKVRLAVVEADESELVRKLQRAEIDLALTYKIHIDETIAFEPIAELPTHVVLGEDHPLAGRPALNLRDLAAEPFILLDMPLSRDYFLALFAAEGIEPNIVAASEYPETVRSYVACGFGYSLMTARPANMAALNGKGLAYVPLSGVRAPMLVVVASLKGMRKTRAAEAFEAMVRDTARGGGLPGMAPLPDTARAVASPARKALARRKG